MSAMTIVHAAGDSRVESVVDDRPGIRPRRVRDDRDVRPVGPHAELVDGCRPEGVGRSEDHRVAGCGVAARELADRRGLAGPVDPHDEHDRRPALDRRLGHPDEVAGDQPRRELGADVRQRAIGTLSEARHLDDVHRQRRADVTGDERLLDVVPGRIIGTGPDDASEAGHETATRALEAGVERANVFRLDGRRR